MSTEKRKKQTKSKTKEQLKEELKSVAGVDARRDIVRIAIAGLLLIFTLFLAIALISNIFTGAEDQSDVMAGTNFHAQNKGGLLGAYCAYFLMNKMFGIGAFITPFFLACVVMKMMIGASCPIRIWKVFIHSTIISVLLSVDMAFISENLLPTEVTDLFSFELGGMHGKELVGMIETYVGTTVAFIILAVVTVFYIGYWFISVFIWIFKGFHRLGNLIFGKREDDEEEEEETSEESDSDDEDTAADSEESAPEDEENEGDENEDDEEANEKEEIAEDNEEEEESDTNLDLTDMPETDDEPTATTAETNDDAIETETEKGNADTALQELPDEQQPKAIQLSINDVKEEETADSKTMEGNNPDEPLGLYNPKLDLERYVYPTIDLLKHYETTGSEIDMHEQDENKNRIITVLRNFGVEIEDIKATIGPTVTLYEIKPAQGVRIARIRNLEDDIALSLSALGIRIIAPIPGKGTIGIEVPNKRPKIVPMESIINTQKFKDTQYELPIALGKTITNEIFMVDLTKMPHLLVAGATGQGKSVGLNAIVASLLYKKHPAELKFVMIDPKKVEFSMYTPLLKHFLAEVPGSEEPVITDVKQVVNTLKSLCQEMDERYNLLKLAHCRTIKEYNNKFCHRNLNPENGHHYMPYIVVIIDEFGDLIMTAGKEVELPIARIAQLARAVGIHMIIATQSPRATIITGKIKANFPARMAFKVAQRVESQTILDRSGANNLIGRGDMLFQAGNDITRVQCAFIDTPEIEAITEYIAKQQAYPCPFELPLVAEDGGDGMEGIASTDGASTFEQVARFVVNTQTGSTSKIQRTFSVGFNRAGRLMDQLEEAGIVGPQNGSKPREVLVQSEIELLQILQSLREAGKKFE